MSLILRGKKHSIGFAYAWNGLLQVIRRERNFQIHLSVAFIVIIAGFSVKLSIIEWLIVLLIITCVLVAEMVNSAIELLLDYVNPAIHPTAKLIKDMSAGAVLIAAFASIIIGCLIFIPKLLAIFHID